jgi:hypothetical protein
MLLVSIGPVISIFADELPPLIGRSASITVAKPGQLSVSPSGDRLALTDRFSNRIHILDTRGNVLWSVSEGVTLNQPQAIFMSDAGTVVFSQWDSRLLFRVIESTPQVIDTVVDLSGALGMKARIMRIVQRRDKSYLILTDNPEQLVHFAFDWTDPHVIAKGGSGKGKLYGSTACAELPAGRLVVVGNGNYPVQLFDNSGRFLTAADWNNPMPQGGWIGSALAVDQRERIWVADLTKSVFRRYDLTGTSIDIRPFSSPVSRPVDMAVTSDNQLFVLNDNGRLDMYDLGQE